MSRDIYTDQIERLTPLLSNHLLTDYLKEREVEVMDIMAALFDDEEIERRYYLRIKREESESIAKKDDFFRIRIV